LSTDQELLLQILLREDHPDIKLLDGTYRKVPAKQAALMVRKCRYEWCGSRHRVRKIRLIATPAPAWRPCHRTTSAASLPPSIEWCRSRLSSS
jgi:hypothetical protein